jgi:chromate reductase, NAD(P)H dehydrogenase (quinone)
VNELQHRCLAKGKFGFAMQRSGGVDSQAALVTAAIASTSTAAYADHTSMRLLTLCGSLRARSSNRAVLRAYARVAAARCIVEHYEGLGRLPHFNPDLEDGGVQLPREVMTFRRAVIAADALVISTPEYVHALPGSFKNALDWLVSEPAFAGKPVVILHIARGSDWALASLQEVLTTMSARLIQPAAVSLPLGSNQVDEDTILQRPDLHAALAHSLEALIASSKQPNPDGIA